MPSNLPSTSASERSAASSAMSASGPIGLVNERLKDLRPLWAPAAIVLAAGMLIWFGRPLPASLSGLRTAGPYAALVAAVVLAWWFNRGRSFVIATSLLAAFAAWSTWHTKGVF